MRTDSLVAILAMAAVTYLTRIGGPWMVRLVQGNRRVEACLSRLPGSILASLLAPLVFAAGSPEVAASAVTLLVSARVKSMPLALIAGVGTLAILRRLM